MIRMVKFVVAFRSDASGLNPDLPYESAVSISSVFASCWSEYLADLSMMK